MNLSIFHTYEYLTHICYFNCSWYQSSINLYFCTILYLYMIWSGCNFFLNKTNCLWTTKNTNNWSVEPNKEVRGQKRPWGVNQPHLRTDNSYKRTIMIMIWDTNRTEREIDGNGESPFFNQSRVKRTKTFNFLSFSRNQTVFTYHFHCT